MATIKNFEQMTSHLAACGRRLRIAIVCGSDHCTLSVALRTLTEGFAHILFVGDTQMARQEEALKPFAEHVEFVEPTTGDDAAAAARRAVELVREGRADILMKGLINTDVLLRAVLDKECGLLPRGRVLTHVTVAQIPTLNRLLFFTDAAVIPYPTHEQRLAQVDYLVEICKSFGIDAPRIALTHCSEKVSEKFPHTLEYRALCEEAVAGRWGATIVDGPLDVRTSIDPVALQTKGIASPLEGCADALVFPDIEAGNTFYKTITFLAGADVAGVLQGPECPVVLSSRGDSSNDKYYSLAFAAMTALSR